MLFHALLDVGRHVLHLAAINDVLHQFVGHGCLFLPYIVASFPPSFEGGLVNQLHISFRRWAPHLTVFTVLESVGTVFVGHYHALAIFAQGYLCTGVLTVRSVIFELA